MVENCKLQIANCKLFRHPSMAIYDKLIFDLKLTINNHYHPGVVQQIC